MKTNKLHIFALLAFGGVIALGPIARADDTPAVPAPAPAPAPGADAPAGRPNMREQMEKLFTAINATDDEKEKLRPIFKERNEKFKALRDDTSASQEDRMAKRKKINKEVTAKVKEGLTADQFTQYQAFMKSHAGRGPGRGQAAPPPADSPAPPKN